MRNMLDLVELTERDAQGSDQTTRTGRLVSVKESIEWNCHLPCRVSAIYPLSLGQETDGLRWSRTGLELCRTGGPTSSVNSIDRHGANP